ncbi:MAG: hypothetical protein JJ900_16825 [Rhodospirillales bacterium]|nr:hypothetical protein [Rhodospirillales bacterium]MBO6788513.1 hypothetical protein [Rhodospirillales bacterium]
MATIEQIRELTDNPRLLGFAEFVLDQAGDAPFPDYKKIDLMDIAPLVRFVWVIDFRNGIQNRPKFVFSGTQLDEHYGMNIVGKCFEEIYVEGDFDRAITGNYYQVYAQKKVAYTFRRAHYFDDYVDRYKCAEAIAFPCSANGTDIDYGLGFIEYSATDAAPDEKIFKLL